MLYFHLYFHLLDAVFPIFEVLVQLAHNQNHLFLHFSKNMLILFSTIVFLPLLANSQDLGLHFIIHSYFMKFHRYLILLYFFPKIFFLYFLLHLLDFVQNFYCFTFISVHLGLIKLIHHSTIEKYYFLNLLNFHLYFTLFLNIRLPYYFHSILPQNFSFDLI